MSSKVIKMIDEAIEADDVDEIVLDENELNEISPELKKKLESIEGISTLSLNNCKLKSLNNFPNLPSLIRLELMNNEFSAADLKHIAVLAELQSLSISDNTIGAAEDLSVLSKLPLAQLDISGTPLAEQQDYRDKVFKLFKDLQILDNKDKEGNEVEYEDDEEFEDDEEGDDDLDDDEEGFDDEEDDDEDDGNNKKTKK